jgi:hypothetical protein
MPAAWGWTTSKLRFSLWIFRIVSRRCLRFTSFQWLRVEGLLVAFWIFCGGLVFMLLNLSTLNSTLPGPVGETYSVSPVQDTAATIYTIANTGAMLSVGQKCTKEIAA